MFKNLTVGAKIVFGFVVILLIFLFVSSYGTIQLVSINDNLTLLKERDYEVLRNAEQMKMSVVQVQQWLTDASATGWTDGYDEAKTWSKTFAAAYTELIELSPEDSGQLADIKNSFDAYYAEGIKMADDYVKIGREAGNKKMKEFDSFAEAINEKVDAFKESKFKIFIDRFGATSTSTANARSVNLWLSIAGILLGIILSYLIRNNIVSLLKTLITKLSEGSDQVTSASGQISSSSQSLAQGATQQASSLEETSSALDEMASQTKQNAENAENANELALQTKTAAENGVSAMADMETAMTDINDSSGKISKIIKVIEEIAFQTNLLALNAAVEAARAGEAGKGFAVVAEEVRNLAQRSATAAKDTASLIEESVTRAENGGKIAAQAGNALNEIVGNVKKMTELVSQITIASKEQADGVNQVNRAVAEMDKITQQNAANAEETASASEELNTQAVGLQDMVNQMVAIVGGVNSGATSYAVRYPESNFAPAKNAQTQAKAQLPRIAQGGRQAKQVVNPDDVIPIDDDKFKDF